MKIGGAIMPKYLKELTLLLQNSITTNTNNPLITSIVHDSRKVEKGSLFICLSGAKVDGHDYIKQAIEQGAAAILTEKAVADIPNDIVVVQVADTRAAMKVIAPYFFDYPSRKLRLIGVTGTNGKTTTTYLLKSIFNQAGYKVGVIGTIQILIEDKVIPTANTTPDVIELQSVLAQMVTAGIDYVVMEVSSHALALERVTGCEFDVGIFTNMTRDHLDFHHTFENYLEAKSKLFQLISTGNFAKKGKTAVINGDDSASTFILNNTVCRKITYGIETKADINADSINVKATGAEFNVVSDYGTVPLHLNITGRFNIYNVLAAIGAAVAEGVAMETIKNALECFTSVAGRFELVQAGQDYAVIVDYAHTPDGLENILKTAKEIAKNRIIVVFGCGGDRDRTKRPIMGRLAVQYGDVVIATSDNPRTEDPAFILEEIEAGIKDNLVSGKEYEKIVDRRSAIAKALQLAQPDDIVIIAGKGHENYQILKDKTIHFDDKEVVREILGS